ncbi:hypothetical protein O9992_08110 [Vibrio lentus]|nr:hypothetical protein [Vibrio lentus]
MRFSVGKMERETHGVIETALSYYDHCDKENASFINDASSQNQRMMTTHQKIMHPKTKLRANS